MLTNAYILCILIYFTDDTMIALPTGVIKAKNAPQPVKNFLKTLQKDTKRISGYLLLGDDVTPDEGTRVWGKGRRWRVSQTLHSHCPSSSVCTVHHTHRNTNACPVLVDKAPAVLSSLRRQTAAARWARAAGKTGTAQLGSTRYLGHRMLLPGSNKSEKNSPQSLLPQDSDRVKHPVTPRPLNRGRH